MKTPLRVLIVEDSEDDAELLLRELKKGGYEPSHRCVQSVEGVRGALAEAEWDLVISDYSMPQFNGSQALRILKESGKEIPFIFVSGTMGEDAAVEAMRLGVDDYFVKGNLSRLLPAIRRELDQLRDRRKQEEMERALHATEERLRQAQKMEAIVRLAGGVAHDFNNLISVILGYTELIQKDFASDNRHGKDLNEIKKCAQRAVGLTRQLLAFSRQQVLQPRLIDLNAAVKDTSAMLKRLIGEDIDLVTALDPDVKRILADPGQLEQVLMNLVVNARDAMPGGGKVVLETANVSLERRQIEKYPEILPGPYVMLSVKDTGIGMDEATMSRIFEPFFTTKWEGKGTGLGLATVFGIIKQSSGHILVESQPGKGAVFQVYFPPAAKDVVETATQEPVKITSFQGTETILLVEDEQALRDLARRVILRHGYQSLEAANAGEALIVCEQNKGNIDLVLTDIVMPKMNGYDLMQRLKETRPQLKVLFMTGYADPDILKRVVEQGLPLLRKPFTPEDLARKIREVLEATSSPAPVLAVAPKNILLVEDNPGDRDLITKGLWEMWPVEKVHPAGSAEEALEVLGKDPLPRLMILNLSLPKMSGMDFLKRIRAEARTKDLPVVILTSSQEERDALDGLRLGVKGYIAKNADAGKFMQAVKMLAMYV